MNEGLSSSSHIIHLTTKEELAEFERYLKGFLINNDFQLDDSVENWLDSEFNRIYVTYAYPDVTKVN